MILEKNTKSNILIISNLLSWFVIAFLLYQNLANSDVQSVKKLTAERIDIIGERGNIVMALSNKKWIPGPSFNGKEYPKWVSEGRNQQNGIIFFNDEGDEVGGLIYNAIAKDSGDYWAGGHFSFDQYKQNQVVAMQYLDNSRSRRAGLRVWDRPANVSMDKQLNMMVQYQKNKKKQAVRDSLLNEIREARARGDYGTERLFIGSQNEVAQLQLRDRSGNIRARFYVDSLNQARLEFLNEEGSVVSRYPPI